MRWRSSPRRSSRASRVRTAEWLGGSAIEARTAAGVASPALATISNISRSRRGSVSTEATDSLLATDVACHNCSRMQARSAQQGKSGLRLPEAVDDAVGIAADRGVEDQFAVVVGRVAQQVRFAVEHEAGALEVGADHRRIDAVELVDHGARVAAGAG